MYVMREEEKRGREIKKSKIISDEKRIKGREIKGN